MQCSAYLDKLTLACCVDFGTFSDQKLENHVSMHSSEVIPRILIYINVEQRKHDQHLH